MVLPGLFHPPSRPGPGHASFQDRQYDGVDQDCLGDDDFDADGDGWSVLDGDCWDDPAHVALAHTVVVGTDSLGTTLAWEQPTAAAVYPGAPGEVWYDGVDTDCDGADDFDQDGDGFQSDDYPHWNDSGEAVFGEDCLDDPAGSALDHLNQALLDAEVVNPAANETWYDGTDQDCDGNDCDADGDGFEYSGSPWCEPEDCDDENASVYPGADEICDDLDNDCDGSKDEDANDAAIWYADHDGDGYGDPSNTSLACEAPSGFVANGDDCDDDVFTGDMDGDGIGDCEDDDRDGDGLRDIWDADPSDGSVDWGPVRGLGTEGDHVVSGTEVQGQWSLLSGGASAGTTSITVVDASVFGEGDEVLVISQQGVDAGTWDTVFVSSVVENTLGLEPMLDVDLASESIVLVQRIPHYEDVSIPLGNTISAEPWSGAGGGVVVFRAAGTVFVAGNIDVSDSGYLGGVAGYYGPESASGLLSGGGGDGGNGGGYAGCDSSLAAGNGGGTGGNGGDTTWSATCWSCGTGGGGGYDGGGGGGGGGSDWWIAGDNGGHGGTGSGAGGSGDSSSGGGGGGGAHAYNAAANDSDGTLLVCGGGASAGAGGGGGGNAGWGAGGEGGHADGIGGERGLTSCGGGAGDPGTDGGDGGSGGGMVMFWANELQVTGRIGAGGGAGGAGGDGGFADSYTGQCGGGGGGGSGGVGATGGTLFLAASNMSLGTALVSAVGGDAGDGGSGGTTDCGGGNGGDGTAGAAGDDGFIFLFYDSLSGSTTPSHMVLGAFEDATP